ncbi:hypothetical protein NQ314_005236 [Rhamnusium bicolor]|uniref:Uncharacterized protein n=1 Tax=Rhamnusium bicolor TaxID=1586634 RepID=A0AAV8ZIU9_9CUCU|nr:hypothetical protein NQ314_005236 [Rhamnusium bicolor]
MVKTYQLAGSGYGTSLKIAPVTTETEENAITCLQVNGTVENKILPQSILPSLVGFECAGDETIDGVLTEKWILTQTIGQKVNKYTMWIIYKSDPNNPDIKVAVPKRYEMRGFNSLLGSHYDHYYLEYDFYDINEIPKTTFEIEPSPGDKHIYTFNPMAEFIRPEETRHVDFEFKKFIHKHRKQYGNEKEHTVRKEIFRQNIRFIHAVNRQNRGYSLTVNHLADKTDLELKALRGKKYTGEYNGGQPFPYKNIHRDNLPQQFDWRIFGAVTPVKSKLLRNNQSVCGSCWSFGTVGAIEGAFFIKNGGSLVRLSQQALIDCSWGYGNNGCDGGEDFRAYKWMLKHGGIPTEEEYGPYLGQDGYCHEEKVPKVAKITGWVNVTANDENALRFALGNKEDQLDHAVLAVGYGSINGKDYWLIKNSWSNYWGNDGYVLMAAKDNNCGVMTTPTYVTM